MKEMVSSIPLYQGTGTASMAKNTTTVLYHFKTVRTVLAVLRSQFEYFVMLEVTAFFKP
jgi:hypothetical protein